MADLASARTAQKLDLSNAEWREIIMQHELFVVFADQRIDLLFVRSRPERRHHQGLCFTACEQRRSVSSRQHFDLAADRSNILQASPIDTALLLNHQAAEELSPELIESPFNVLFSVRKFRKSLRHDLALHLADLLIAF